jgi:hypothetical protein
MPAQLNTMHFLSRRENLTRPALEFAMQGLVTGQIRRNLGQTRSTITTAVAAFISKIPTGTCSRSSRGRMAIEGSCLCGAATFELKAPTSKFVHCHCSRCRKATGAGYATNIYVEPSQLIWKLGRGTIERYDYSAARRGEQPPLRGVVSYSAGGRSKKVRPDSCSSRFSISSLACFSAASLGSAAGGF